MTAASQPFPALAGQQFMLLTTFRKSGQPIPTPVWFAESGGKVYVFTQPDAGKVKRVRANGRAELAPCDRQGAVLGPSAPARGRVLPPEEAERVRRLFAAKYGLMFRMFGLVELVRRAKPAYLELWPADAATPS